MVERRDDDFGAALKRLERRTYFVDVCSAEEERMALSSFVAGSAGEGKSAKRWQYSRLKKPSISVQFLLIG
jgi:hypothetical protein